MIDAAQALKGYDALWKEYRRSLQPPSGKDAATPRESRRSCKVIASDLLQHCTEAYALYAALEGAESYRAAMWERRLFLHGQGRHGEVWDGKDPIRWQQAAQRGEVGTNPFVEQQEG